MSTRCGIYEIVHDASGRRYVGHSSRIENRWRTHCHLLNGGRHYARHLQNAWEKYGPASFSFSVLEECAPEALVAREQFYIDALHPVFNVARAAGSRLGVPQSAEVRERISKSLTGRGRSAETAKKLSLALTGRKLSPEHCTRISDAKRNLSSETRARMSAAGMGRKASAETRLKMSLARKGRPKGPRAPTSQEARDNMKAAQRSRRERERGQL